MDPVDQGIRSSQYTIIPRNLIFLTTDDCILLLKGAPDKRLWANKYNGIGGHIKSGESPLSSAHRELFEETGLTIKALNLRAVIHISLPQPPGIMLFVFVGVGATGKLRSSSEGKPEWVLKSEYLKLELVEDLYTLLPRVLEPGPLIFGTYSLGVDGLHMTFEGDSNLLNSKEVTHA